MTELIVLILVAIIVSQNVEVLKKIKNFFWFKEWQKGKYGLILSIMVASWAAIVLNIGITSAILQTSQLVYELPKYFHYFDIFSSALLMSQGASYIINIYEKFKEFKQTK